MIDVIGYGFPYQILIEVNAKLPWRLLGSFQYVSLLNPYGSQCKMAPEAPGQFPAEFLIQSLSKTNAKWPRRLLSSFL